MNYDERQTMEHELINRKLTWLLTSQSILFAAVAFAMEKIAHADTRIIFVLVVSYLGVSISTLIFIGVLMCICAKYLSYRDERRKWKQTKNNDTSVRWGVRTPITVVGLIPDIFMPVAFMMAWTLLIDYFN
ncbi:MAG TPA: hypothetical protein VD993_15765 [Chitinophagaceae bacterium]|nr:hypothetical protein [Chitinophagaceae bacterium]